MVDPERGDETPMEEIDQTEEELERRRRINARLREAAQADLIDDAERVAAEPTQAQPDTEAYRRVTARLREAAEADLLDDADRPGAEGEPPRPG